MHNVASESCTGTSGPPTYNAREYAETKAPLPQSYNIGSHAAKIVTRKYLRFVVASQVTSVR